jgi:hypothetical protein
MIAISIVTDATYLASPSESVDFPSEELLAIWETRQSALRLADKCVEQRLKRFSLYVETLSSQIASNERNEAELSREMKDEGVVAELIRINKANISYYGQLAGVSNQFRQETSAFRQEHVKPFLTTATEHNSKLERYKYPYDISYNDVTILLEEKQPTLSSHYQGTDSRT